MGRDSLLGLVAGLALIFFIAIQFREPAKKDAVAPDQVAGKALEKENKSGGTEVFQTTSRGPRDGPKLK